MISYSAFGIQDFVGVVHLASLIFFSILRILLFPEPTILSLEQALVLMNEDEIGGGAFVSMFGCYFSGLGKIEI